MEGFTYKKRILSLLLLLTFLISPFLLDYKNGLVHTGGKEIIVQIFKAALRPDISSEILSLAVISSIRTLSYAVAGTTVAIVLGFIFGTLSSGVLISNSLVANASKNILEFMRTIHELVWAWLFVTAFGLSPYAAILAIAIPYGGILGRIYSNNFKSVPIEPILHLKSSGASKLQCLFYAYLPMASKDIISYSLYRFECAVRSSTVMSFVGLGGLGYQIQLALDDLNFSRMWTYFIFLLLMIIIIELWSNALRKRLIE
ncbi:Phosphate-import permease protein PhnE [Caloramator mitchellensis]|uniref:Phosphate-import permease protein PhnE n=1 Tax=Caloramator mitchellensis TaxID=908809 RepID=A0A0R3JYH7_CALMK|nr:ABC transporter permease subunit [Caloramator mitchellensis]KRQ86196.1 Phosphate-import permease protein PhnE [Caloramator mitchellensis]